LSYSELFYSLRLVLLLDLFFYKNKPRMLLVIRGLSSSESTYPCS
jgi:hypothetical protein